MSESIESLLQRILDEQRKTNQILLMLVEALAEEEDIDRQEPRTYLDGTPVTNA